MAYSKKVIIMIILIITIIANSKKVIVIRKRIREFGVPHFRSVWESPKIRHIEYSWPGCKQNQNKYSPLTGSDALVIGFMVYYKFSYSFTSLYQKIPRSLFSKSRCFHAEIILESWRNFTITEGGLLAYSGGLFSFGAPVY